MRYIIFINSYPSLLNVFINCYLNSSLIFYSLENRKLKNFTDSISLNFFWFFKLCFLHNYLTFCSATFWLFGIMVKLVVLDKWSVVCWIRSGNLIWLEFSKNLIIKNFSLNWIFKITVYSLNCKYLDSLFLFLFYFGWPPIYRSWGLVVHRTFYRFLSFKMLLKRTKIKNKGKG